LQFKRTKRNVNGVLLLDKPLGFSSNQALQKVKWLFQAAKAGHTGTLDPLATGLLPICLGEATKFAQYLTDADKTYIAKIKLGETTTTGDAEGETLDIKPVDVSLTQFKTACQPFLGEIQQMPPMYSALKHEGKEDIGKALDCGAHLVGLRRTETANYLLEQVVTVEALEAMALEERDQLLLPVHSAIEALPRVTLDEDASFYLMQGQPVWVAGKVPDSELRLYDESDHFLGLGFLQDDGKVAPKRLIKKSD